jgi:glycosyltransferase involved in cell wall biosynthesis
MPIPPKAWGAVEILIWDYYQELIKLGHEVKIVNESSPGEIINQVNDFRPEFVHLQYDNYAHLLAYIECKYKAVTSHYGYIEQYHAHPEYHGILKSFIDGDFYIFCLSEAIKQTYLKLGVKAERLFVTPNGGNQNCFEYRESPRYPSRSIFLAKIDYRKRQYLYQNIDFLDFVGNCVDSRFNTEAINYLGEWDKTHLYQNLTDYSSLVLLSDGEADPLVTKEALICGLGLVLSEFAAANLDTTLPFIDIIPESRIRDIDYVKTVILENQQKSINHRSQIRQYAILNHSWGVVAEKYIDLLNKIIKK